MKKRWSILLAFVLLLSLLCGCGSKNTMDLTDDANYAPGVSEDQRVGGLTASSWSTESDLEYVSAPAEAPLPMPEPDLPADQAPSAGLPDNVKIIYTADINLESTDFDAVVRGMEALVANLGGYFEYSNLENYNSNYRTGNYTVRVPAEQFEAFCSGVGGLGQVNSISRNAQDVSEAYYDMESRLATQRTKMERLQALLAKADNMENIISLENAISETELAIEQLTGSLRKYDSLVGYSTVHIYLQEVYQLTEQEQPAIGFGAKLAAAFRSGCSSFVYGIQDLLITLARGWVGWLIFLAVIVVVLLVFLRLRRQRKARRTQVKPAQLEVKDGSNESKKE